MTQVNSGRGPRIAIIGAGVTGLLLAQGFKKIGFDVTVYEKQEGVESKFREWTMALHWALPIFQTILPDDIQNDIRSTYTNPFHPYDKENEIVYFYHGFTGESLLEIPVPGRRISRTRLRRLCCRGLDIQWGHLVQDIVVPDEESAPVTINFDGKEPATADLVIGTDGAHSKIRTWLFGEEAAKCQETGYVLANGIVWYKSADQAKFTRGHDTIGSIARLPGGMAFLTSQDVGDPEDPLTWSFHIARMWYDPEVKFTDGAEAITLAKSTMSDPAICERFRSTFQNIDEERSKMFASQLHHWKTVPWDNHGGRVTLAGDAAHPMHPNRGQGLNQALNDIDKIIAQFIRVRDEGGSFTVKDALNEYEKDVFVRGRKAVLDSLEDTKAMTSPEPEMFKTESAHGTRGLAK
ncbi:hypothetical protein V8F20_007901 [Naviculisporaceae sp. PSN 640]